MDVTLWVLVFANAAVIVGVIFEEDEKVEKFINLRRKYGWAATISLLRKRGIRTLREFGFVTLVIGLGVELLAQTVSEVGSNSKLETATNAIAKLGIASNKLQAYVQSRQEAIESAEKRLDAAVKAANERLADRVLTSDQVSALTNTANRFQGQKFNVAETCPLLECTNLAKQIAVALLTAKWIPGTDQLPVAMGGSVAAGVMVGWMPNSKAETQIAGNALVDALTSAHVLTLRGFGSSSPIGDTIVVSVGTHP